MTIRQWWEKTHTTFEEINNNNNKLYNKLTKLPL